jgi:hypothetical protein
MIGIFAHCVIDAHYAVAQTYNDVATHYIVAQRHNDGYTDAIHITSIIDVFIKLTFSIKHGKDKRVNKLPSYNIHHVVLYGAPVKG